MDIKISPHAKKRAKQRLGLSKKAVKNLARKAWLNGSCHGDFSGSFGRYIDKLKLAQEDWRRGRPIRLYGEVLFVYDNDGTLVTLYQIPRRYVKTATS